MCAYVEKKCWDALYFFFSSRRRHTRSKRDWSSDVCSSDLQGAGARARAEAAPGAETLQAGNRKAHREARAADDEEDRLDPREPSYPLRSRARSTFPRWVRGSASRKITSRGYLYGSSRPRTNACSYSASPSRRSLATTKACGLTSPCSPTMPTTATSCTAGCCSRQFSTSCGASHLPDTLSRSSARPQ